MQAPPPPPPPPEPQVVLDPALVRKIAEIRAAAAEAQAASAPLAPLAPRQVAVVRARRTELSNQLNSATERRDRLAKQLATSEGESRAGLEQRIAVLDRRIIQLETDIAETGRLLTTSAIGATGSSTAQTPLLDRLDSGDVVGLGVLFIIAVLGPISFAMARLAWRRGSVPPPPRPATDPATRERLERIEQAVEAIALEVERVSEGQRFVTRILAEGRGPGDVPALAAGVGAAEPVRAPAGGDPVPLARGRNGA